MNCEDRVVEHLLDHADYMDEGEKNYQDYINTIRLNMPQEYCKQPQLDLCVQRMKEALVAEKQRAEKAEALVKTLVEALRKIERVGDGVLSANIARSVIDLAEAKAPGAEGRNDNEQFL